MKIREGLVRKPYIFINDSCYYNRQFTINNQPHKMYKNPFKKYN